jgi:hypothetical protein
MKRNRSDYKTAQRIVDNIRVSIPRETKEELANALTVSKVDTLRDIRDEVATLKNSRHLDPEVRLLGVVIAGIDHKIRRLVDGK